MWQRKSAPPPCLPCRQLDSCFMCWDWFWLRQELHFLFLSEDCSRQRAMKKLDQRNRATEGQEILLSIIQLGLFCFLQLHLTTGGHWISTSWTKCLLGRLFLIEHVQYTLLKNLTSCDLILFWSIVTQFHSAPALSRNWHGWLILCWCQKFHSNSTIILRAVMCQQLECCTQHSMKVK